MSTKTKHYCSCNPKSKPAAEREEAKWYCFRHRRHLCDNCIYDELNQRHISCLVGTYDEFIQSPPTAYAQFKQNKCPLCMNILPDDDARAVVRLNCACVYHSNCLQQYLLSYPSNNAQCPNTKCKKLITTTTSKRSNLGHSVDNFLRSVSRQRLWNKPKHTTASTAGQNHVINEEKTQIIPQNQTETRKGKHTGHIVLDTREMTRHRTVKSSLNKDGNLEDDKYHKPIRKRKVNRFKKGYKSWSTRKVLVVLLLCCALMAQGWFLYMIFGKNNTESNDIDNKNVNRKNKFNVDPLVLAKQGSIEGMVNNLPPKLKHEILGNKLKYQDLQKRLID